MGLRHSICIVLQLQPVATVIVATVYITVEHGSLSCVHQVATTCTVPKLTHCLFCLHDSAQNGYFYYQFSPFAQPILYHRTDHSITFAGWRQCAPQVDNLCDVHSVYCVRRVVHNGKRSLLYTFDLQVPMFIVCIGRHGRTLYVVYMAKNSNFSALAPRNT